MEFQKLEGERRGTFLYSANGFCYTKYKTYKASTYLRCRHYRTKNCKAKARIDGHNNFNIIEGHNHGGDENEVAIVKFKNDLKQQASSTKLPLTEVYAACSLDYSEEVRSKVTYTSIKSTLKRCRDRAPKEDVPVEGGSGGGIEICVICRGEVTEKWATDPCGHHPFCEQCTNAVMSTLKEAEDGTVVAMCPVCRGPLKGTIRIFNCN